MKVLVHSTVEVWEWLPRTLHNGCNYLSMLKSMLVKGARHDLICHNEVTFFSASSTNARDNTEMGVLKPLAGVLIPLTLLLVIVVAVIYLRYVFIYVQFADSIQSSSLSLELLSWYSVFKSNHCNSLEARGVGVQMGWSDLTRMGMYHHHHNDVIMSSLASQITSLTNVYSTVYSRADQRKHQNSASLAFVWGIHGWPVYSPHKGPVTRKMFPFDDVIKIVSPAKVARWHDRPTFICTLVSLSIDLLISKWYAI